MPPRTVKIKNPARDSAYSLINESDFDPDKHTLFTDDASPVPTPSAPAGGATRDDAPDVNVPPETPQAKTKLSSGKGASADDGGGPSS